MARLSWAMSAVRDLSRLSSGLLTVTACVGGATGGRGEEGEDGEGQSAGETGTAGRGREQRRSMREEKDSGEKKRMRGERKREGGREGERYRERGAVRGTEGGEGGREEREGGRGRKSAERLLVNEGKCTTDESETSGYAHLRLRRLRRENLHLRWRLGHDLQRIIHSFTETTGGLRSKCEYSTKYGM